MGFKNSQNFITLLKGTLILGIPMVILYVYNYSNIDLKLYGFSIKKITSESEEALATAPSIGTVRVEGKQTEIDELDSIKTSTSEGTILKTTIPTSQDSATITEKTSEIAVSYPKSDSSSQRVLLIGDSEAGGIMRQLNDYCVENGHKLVGVLSWFSATALNFGYSTKVDELIQRFKPTLIFVVVGLNELYAKDLKKRLAAAQKLRQKLNGIQYVWVGPANYKEDYGINKVYEQAAGSDHYVLSKNLNLPKSTDKRHPNQKGYAIWMRYISQQIQANPIYKFPFKPAVKSGAKFTAKVVMANAAKDKGY